MERKLASLERKLRGIGVSAQVVLERERHRHVVEITLHARGDHMLHALGDSGAWDTSLTEAVEKVIQQVQKLKGKWDERKRLGSARTVANAEAAKAPSRAAAAGSSPVRVRRAGRYPIKPMTVDEAALAIEDGAEAFIVFRNADTDEVNVVYRRKRGGLGLIEPES